jgi:hypothetical protein
MTKGLSESDLLAYVEGELEAIQVQQIRERLADEGHVLAALERMREDRKLLRTAGEPAPPIDFLTELEPQLARPMLIEPPPPGAYRRRHRRRRQATRLARLGLVAAVLLVISGAVWVAFSVALPRMGGGADRRLRAQDDRAAAEAGDRAVASTRTPAEEVKAGESVWPPPGTVILHEHPLPPGPGFVVAMSAGEAEAGEDSPSPLGGDGAEADVTFVSAEFALIVPAEDLASGERLLEEALAAVAPEGPGQAEAPVALVRNFSEAEARGLIARYFHPVPRGSSTPDRYVEVGGEPDQPSFEDPVRGRRWVDRMLRQLRARHHEEADEILLSAHLLGPDELAASYERQLSFSGRGATHTITIPAASLPGMLTRLYEADGASTILRVLPPENEAISISPEARRERARGAVSLRRWADDHRRIRRFLAQLRQRPEGEAYVLLPVVIQTPPEAAPARR